MERPGRRAAAYRTSIAYSLTSLLSFVERRHDDDLVVVMLGDHQPSTIVSGFGGNRDVPVTVIARDPQVVAAALRLGLAGRAATERHRAGVADGRLPRPVPHGVQQPAPPWHRPAPSTRVRARAR